MPSLPDPYLTRYWLEFEPPSDPPGYLEAWPPGRCGVTAYTLEDALYLLREHVFLDTPVPKVRSVKEDVDLSQPGYWQQVRAHMGAPNWRGVWFPFLGGYDCWRRDVGSWRTNPSMRCC